MKGLRMKSVARTLLSLVRSGSAGRHPAWLTVFALVSLTAVGIAQRGQTPGDAIESRPRGAAPVHARRPVDSPRPVGIETLPPAAQGQISAAIGQDVPVYHVVAEPHGLRMNNAGRRVSAEFTPAGVSFQHDTHRWAMSLRGYGYGDSVRKTTETVPTGTLNRVEYRRGALTEWYLNGPLGLEQGFTLDRAPGTSGGQPLTLAFALSGNVTASVDAGGRSLTLRRDGAAALRYGGLTALDADGRALRAWLEAAGDELRVRVDDANARYPVTIDPYVQGATLTTRKLCDPTGVCDDGAPGDFFGHSVSISADASTVVVGTPRKWTNNVPTGVLYVFVKPSEFEGGWNGTLPRFKTKLLASDGAMKWGLELGRSVAISGDGETIVAGTFAGLSPAAYVFVRPPNGWDAAPVQTETARLTPAPVSGLQNWATFGESVATSGDGGTIVVGMPSYSTDPDTIASHGAAYVFHRPVTGWIDATEAQKVTGTIASRYGTSVALSEDATILVVGARGDPWLGEPDQTGKTYVLAWQENSGAYATLARLDSSDATPYAFFGMSVSTTADGATIVVGAPASSIYSTAPPAVYVFVRPPTGWGSTGFLLTETAKLTNSDSYGDDAFGASVDISLDGNSIVAGAIRSFSSGLPGTAYVFAKPAAGWATSTEDHSIIASDGMPGNWFGDAVSLSGDGAVAVVGAPRTAIDASLDQGAAYVFTGSAAAPQASVAPSSLTFGSLPIGTTSAPQTVTVINTGSAPLQVTGVSVSGSFSATQNCLSASPIAPGSSCAESVTFAPLSVGFNGGTLAFTSDSGGTNGTTHDVPLQGGGEPGVTSTTITSVPEQVFAGQPVSVSYTVASQGPLTPFGQVTVQASTGESCSGGVQAGSCVLTFATLGDRTITASYNGNANFNPSTSAPVVVRVVDFSLSASPSSQAVAGKKATYRLDVNALNGFTGEVSLTCAGGPQDDTTCTITPASVTVSGSTARAKATVTLPSRVNSGTTYTVIFTGTYGSAVRSTTATLVVK